MKMKSKRNLSGWVRQRPDPRDKFFIIERKDVVRLSATADLTAGMGPLLDQLQEGSCGPNSTAALVAYDDKAQGLPVRTISRQHHYWWTRLIMGTITQDSGVDNRSMLKAANTYGVVPDESLWPYSSDLTVRPPDAVNQVGLQNLITDYAAVIQNLNQMQGVIAGGKPFLFGFDVFSQIDSDQAAQNGILTDPKGSAVGGHDVTFCGYNASSSALPGLTPGNAWPAGYFRFRNHWTNQDGTPWGDGGYGYVSFAYATGPNASDFWVINTIPGSVPPPPPPPPPPPTGDLPAGAYKLQPGTYNLTV